VFEARGGMVPPCPAACKPISCCPDHTARHDPTTGGLVVVDPTHQADAQRAPPEMQVRTQADREEHMMAAYLDDTEHFPALRRRVRRQLAESPTGQQIEELVDRLRLIGAVSSPVEGPL
jgi:hypothetical protein